MSILLSLVLTAACFAAFFRQVFQIRAKDNPSLTNDTVVKTIKAANEIHGVYNTYAFICAMLASMVGIWGWKWTACVLLAGATAAMGTGYIKDRKLVKEAGLGRF